MKLKDLDAATNRSKVLAAVRASYHNRFKDRRNKLRITIVLDNGNTADTTPTDSLQLDLSMEGPIAALVDQAYRKKIAEIEQELREFGITLE